MAFGAELKRRKWFCINGVNMISEYSQKLYNDWHDSLTKEQLKILEKRKKEKSREAMKSLYSMMSMLEIFGGHYYNTLVKNAISYEEESRKNSLL